MAVHAQYYLSHAFPHDHRAIRPALDNATSASTFLGELGGGGHPLAAAVGGNTVLSDLTCNSGCFLPRKRARVVGDVADGAGLIMDLQGQRAPALLPQVPVPAGDVQSRLLCSAAASTSGRPTTTTATVAPVSRGLLSSRLYRHGVEIDALVRIENERLRAGLQEARRRHVRTVVSALERDAARRLRAAEAGLERALARNAELDERLRQTEAEGQAWQDIARSHEGVAAGLRATIDSLMQSPCAGAAGAEGGDAEDAQSCCFELEKEQEQEQERGAEASGWRRARACRACGAADACVLLLPCRHLCLCRGCEAGVGACPVCAATKNGSLHVLLH